MSASDPHAAREKVGAELRRVVRRWQQLPLDHALSVSPSVREVVQRLADEVAIATGLPPTEVPDLGPGVLMDQLRVMVHDYLASDLDPGAVAGRLTQLRRDI